MEGLFMTFQNIEGDEKADMGTNNQFMCLILHLPADLTEQIE